MKKMNVGGTLYFSLFSFSIDEKETKNLV